MWRYSTHKYNMNGTILPIQFRFDAEADIAEMFLDNNVAVANGFKSVAQMLAVALAETPDLIHDGWMRVCHGMKFGMN